MVILICLCRH